MEKLKIGDRIFKLCDDVPLAVKEKRKLFWINNGTVFEVRCISENMGANKNFLFLYDLGGALGEGTLTHYRRMPQHKYNYKLCLDVTPEKRYAIWDRIRSRFAHADTGCGGWFHTRDEAERAIALYWSEKFARVVEFDNPDAE